MTGGGIPIAAMGKGIRNVVGGTTDQRTHETHPGEEGPSQVGASYQEVAGKADHRSQEEASSLEGGNQDQEGKADGLWKVLDDWIAKAQD